MMEQIIRFNVCEISIWIIQITIHMDGGTNVGLILESNALGENIFERHVYAK